MTAHAGIADCSLALGGPCGPGGDRYKEESNRNWERRHGAHDLLLSDACASLVVHNVPIPDHQRPESASGERLQGYVVPTAMIACHGLR